MQAMNDRINARIDPALKEAAEAIFARLGISTGEAIRMFYAQVKMTRGMPFPVRIPNKETLAALAEAREGKVRTYRNTDELFASWDALEDKD